MSDELAFVLSGGGARGAYQAGVLAALGRHFPDLSIDYLCGTSAGAINACYLAGRREPFVEKTQGLLELWERLEVERVFRTDFPNLFGHVTKWGRSLVSGGHAPPVRGLVDTLPLRGVITEALGVTAGRIPGLRENLKEGRLKSFAVSTTSYTTGQSVIWVQGKHPEGYDRPNRVALQAHLTIRHVMASASVPLFFPAVRIRQRWYGDGQVRMNAPFSPAVRMGAKKIFAVSTRYARTPKEAEAKEHEGYPPVAQVLGVLMKAMFLDFFDHDAARLRRINRLVEQIEPGKRMGMRPVRMLMIRPSVDLGRMASQFEVDLPRAFRFLTRGLGTRDVRSNDALSVVMFQSEYLREATRVGQRDVETNLDRIRDFLAS